MKTFKRIMGFGALACYLISTSLLIVEETDYAVISQFGRPVRTVEDAGLTFKLPTPIQTTTVVDRRTRLYALEASEYGTRDRRNVVISSYIIWKVVDPIRFLTSVRETDIAQQRLEALVNSEVGAAIGGVNVDRIFSNDASENRLTDLFVEITRAANEVSVSELGIEIQAVRPNRFGFPIQNLQAIYNRMESEWDRLAKQYRAEGQEAASLIHAETEREVRELKAKAYRDGQEIRGESEAEAALLYAEAFASEPEYYQFTRMMEAYESIFNSQTQLILSTDSPMFDALLNPPARIEP